VTSSVGEKRGVLPKTPRFFCWKVAKKCPFSVHKIEAHFNNLHVGL